MLKIYIELAQCYMKNCNDEFKQRKEIRTAWFKNTTKLHEDYKNKLITQKQLMTKLNKLDKQYFSAIENINLHKCEIEKCYKEVKTKLDYLAEKNKIQKLDNYTLDDYNKFVKINHTNILKSDVDKYFFNLNNILKFTQTLQK
jgi:hypothetical protein